MHFTITGVKKIIRYTEDFVIYRFVISKFHSNTSKPTLTNEKDKKYGEKFNTKVPGFACHL